MTPSLHNKDEPSACVRYDWQQSRRCVTRLFRLTLMYALFTRTFDVELGWGCLTCVDFLSSYERACSAPLLCEREKSIRQVLQSVVQCTETAGAAHQGSMG